MRILRFILIIILFFNVFVSCRTTIKVPGSGKVKIKQKAEPPPHAPAHGYRYKHEHGVVLEFNSSLGAYVVVGKRGLYYHDGMYMQLSKGVWTVAVHYSGPWEKANKGQIPEKLIKAIAK